MLDLNKGVVLDLNKTKEGLKRIDVGLNWGQISRGGFMGFFGSKESVDLDASAIMYDDKGNHIETIYYGNKRSDGVKHSGDDRSGDAFADDKDNETITFELDKLNPKVAKIALVLVSFSGQEFSILPYAGLRIYDTTKNKEILGSANVSADEQYRNKCSMIFGILSKESGTWEYKSVNEGTEFKSLERLVSASKQYL